MLIVGTTNIYNFTVYKLLSDSETDWPYEETLIQFSAYSSNREILLKLNNPNFTSLETRKSRAESSYELVIGGGDEHDTTWLSIIGRKKEQKTRINSAHTPHILNQKHPRTFWIRIGSNINSKAQKRKFIQFGNQLSQENAILTWPVPSNFILSEILTKELPENIIKIR